MNTTPEKTPTAQDRVGQALIWFLLGVQAAVTLATLRDYAVMRRENRRLAALIRVAQADIRQEREQSATPPAEEK